MYRNRTIAVVVPVYNEEALIGRVIETMPDCVDRIVVVDDDSRDGTAEAVRRLNVDKMPSCPTITRLTRTWAGRLPPATSGAATTRRTRRRCPEPCPELCRRAVEGW